MTRGSSPLARGARSRSPRTPKPQGLIPARAGSTAPPRRAGGARWAHPRSRGEHNLENRVCGRANGSSPLARGALALELRDAGGRGLIPARAGSTTARPGWKSIPTAHPRSRGEHTAPTGPAQGTQGSSPLARGAPGDSGGGAAVVGLIPARAGSTASASPTTSRSRAHPRSRGEHRMPMASAMPPTGSSPLARGARGRRARARRQGGLIPARAGSTPAWAAP